MAKLTLTDLTQLSSNETSAVSVVNANNALIEAALEVTLSRDGTTPNTASADYDMNSNNFLNLADPTIGGNAVTKTYGDVNYGGASSIAAAASAAAALVSENAAATSETNAGTSETNAGTSETNAQTSANQALVAAQGWAAVTTLTSGTANVETTDARTFYIVDASSGTVTINLPAIGANDGLSYHFQASNVDNAITVARDGTDYINGVSGDFTTLDAVAQTVHFVADDNTPDNWIVTNVEAVQAASTTQAGISELATDAETATGTATDKVLTPSNLTAETPTIKSIEQQSKSAAYTLVLGDAQKHIYHPAADTTARIWTIPANASVAYPIGTAISFVNETLGGVITIAITTDTMVLAPDGTTGSRTLAASGMATAIKVTSTSWMISGAGLT